MPSATGRGRGGGGRGTLSTLETCRTFLQRGEGMASERGEYFQECSVLERGKGMGSPGARGFTGRADLRSSLGAGAGRDGEREQLTNSLSLNSVAFLSFIKISEGFCRGNKRETYTADASPRTSPPTSLQQAPGPVSGTRYVHIFGISHDLINRHCDQLFSFEVLIRNLGEMTLRNIFRIQVRAQDQNTKRRHHIC